MRIISTKAGGGLASLSAALLAGSILVSGANAADMPVSPAPQPMAEYPDWTGFYLSAGVGAGAVVHELDVLSIFNFNGIGGEGVFGELGVGYDYMISDRLLLGVYGDFRFGNISTDLNLGPISADLTLDHGYDIVGRIGYLVSPETLLYVLGGYSYQHFDVGTNLGLGFDWDTDGWVIGAGLETRLSGNWNLKAEYRYAEYEEDFLTGGLFTLSPSSHTFLLGLNYRFGDRGGPVTAAGFAPVGYDFQGLKLGLGIGAAAGVSDLSLPFFGFDGLGGEGIFGELSIGYDWRIGDRWVAGVYGDFRFSNAALEISLGPIGAEATADYTFDIYGRLGYLVGPETLLYALAGYSNLHTDISALFFGYDYSSGGYVVGAGLEQAISEHSTIKLEYRYADYADEDFGTGGFVQLGTSAHSVMLGITWRPEWGMFGQ